MAMIDRIPDTKQEWFKDAKYGLFIHWGLYSILAGEYKGKQTKHISEWIMNSLDIPVEEYEKLTDEFNPDQFDADALVKMAKEEWGMKYIVFTAKHHEGFAMYHSENSKYNTVDATACHRDIVKELADACKKYDMKFGLYYSQSQDWHDPNGFVSKANGGKETDNQSKDFQSYVDHKVIPQLRELLTNYGEICLIWFDTPMDMTKEQSQQCVDVVKELQPNCLISGRIGNQLGDYMTIGDNYMPRLPLEGDWEVPATLNDTWGYSKFDQSWKTPEEIIKILVKIASRGGNYLLNIGPRADGSVPQESLDILGEVGNYMRENGESIYGTRKAPSYPYEIDWAEFTCRDHKLYVHVFEPRKKLEILNCSNEVKDAYLLSNGQKLKYVCDESCEGDAVVIVDIPEELHDAKTYCVCLELKEEAPIFDPIRG